MKAVITVFENAELNKQGAVNEENQKKENRIYSI